MFNSRSYGIATIRFGLIAALLLAPSFASAEIILDYSVPAGSPPALQTEHPGLDGTQLVEGSAISISGASYTGWATETSTLASAEAAGSYLDFGFTSKGLFTYDLGSLRVQYSVSVIPSEVYLGHKIDGASDFTFTQLTDGGSNIANQVNLSAFDGVTSADFRLVGFSSLSGGANSLTFSEFPVATGYSIGLDAVAVPEPSTWGLCCLGLVAVAWWRRRRSVR